MHLSHILKYFDVAHFKIKILLHQCRNWRCQISNFSFHPAATWKMSWGSCAMYYNWPHNWPWKWSSNNYDYVFIVPMRLYLKETDQSLFISLFITASYVWMRLFVRTHEAQRFPLKSGQLVKFLKTTLTRPNKMLWAGREGCCFHHKKSTMIYS